ncbi:MAG: hypothetical protein V4733_02075 [Verrucomicrobiota bacterium]
MTNRYEEVDALLKPLAAALAREADAILDLRELLVRQGHPGKCVRCFFRLFEAAAPEVTPRLVPLRNWLEGNVEISLRGNGRELEAIPFRLRDEENLEDFCLRSIREVMLDRGYREKKLELGFRYKALAAA